MQSDIKSIIVYETCADLAYMAIYFDVFFLVQVSLALTNIAHCRQALTNYPDGIRIRHLVLFSSSKYIHGEYSMY